MVWVRRIAIILGVLVVLLLLTGATLYMMGGSKLSRAWAVTPPSLVIPSDSATLERGRHLATARFICSDCHGENLAGQVVVDGMPFGRFVSSNLTTGGVGATYTDADWVRAIRHGVRPDSTSLMFMPSNVYANMSGEDLAAVIAYVKSVPPVSSSLPATELGPIGRLVVATGGPLLMAPLIDHQRPFAPAPVEAPTAAFGEYIVNTGGCRECHGQNLAGGKFAGGPEDPPGSNLTPGGNLGQWSEADFIRTMREGRRPDGTELKPFMPWKAYGRMTDTELGAIYNYLRSLPELSYGGGEK